MFQDWIHTQYFTFEIRRLQDLPKPLASCPDRRTDRRIHGSESNQSVGALGPVALPQTCRKRGLLTLREWRHARIYFRGHQAGGSRFRLWIGEFHGVSRLPRRQAHEGRRKDI